MQIFPVLKFSVVQSSTVYTIHLNLKVPDISLVQKDHNYMVFELRMHARFGWLIVPVFCCFRICRYKSGQNGTSRICVNNSCIQDAQEYLLSLLRDIAL